MFAPKIPAQCRPHVYSKSQLSRLPKAMAYLSLMAAPCLDDFTVLRSLGDGSSGTVYLVRENDTCGLYALKAIQKHKRCRTQVEVETVMAERNALLDLRGNDFILQLRACFHDSRNYYLVTEYHPAGDLHTLLLLKGSPQNVVRFYMAELLLALEHTHAKRIVHRDVKPENVFIDNDGHIVLGDFGLARKLRVKEDTLSIDDMFGTPAYTPPEIFTGKSYGCEVDLWAFGVMLYELITGNEAFKSNNVPQDDPTWLARLARNILHDELETSRYLTPDSTDLIEKLLRKCPKTRLRNFDEIKKHPFFFGIDWDLLSNRSLTPPWIPTIGQGNDLGPECPALTAGKPYSAEDDPIRGLSFRFSPMALTPTCQRHQRDFHLLGSALPAVVNWVEGSKPTPEVSSSSSCTDKGSYDLADAGKHPSFSLHRLPMRRKKLRPLTRWARSIFRRCSDVLGS